MSLEGEKNNRKRSTRHSEETRDQKIMRLSSYMFKLVLWRNQRQDDEQTYRKELEATESRIQREGSGVRDGRLKHKESVKRSIEKSRKKQERLTRKINKTQDDLLTL